MLKLLFIRQISKQEQISDFFKSHTVFTQKSLGQFFHVDAAVVQTSVTRCFDAVNDIRRHNV